ncbi:DegV family protein [Lachnospiraceae bacterium LCP25S3_G4]
MFQIITDGSCDLGAELSKKIGVQVVPFYVSFDDERYVKEIEEIGVRAFYDRMVSEPKLFPKSSLPSVQDYINAFEPFVKAGVPILCICITSKFSGSFNSASNAKDILLESYQEAEIVVLDSMVNTVLQGLLVLQAASMKQRGASFIEIKERIEELKQTGRIFFTVGSIDYLVHGGRIGKLAGIAAGTLGIKPLIVLRDGEIYSSGIARGRVKSLKKVREQMWEYIENTTDDPDDYAIAVGYGYDKEEALGFKAKFEEEMKIKYPKTTGQIELLQIGATIGVHTGPHPLGFGIIKKF